MQRFEFRARQRQNTRTLYREGILYARRGHYILMYIKCKKKQKNPFTDIEQKLTAY